MNKESRISVKVDEALKARLAKAAAATTSGEPSLVRALVIALCDYIDEFDEITLPFAVMPRKEMLRLKALERKGPEQIIDSLSVTAKASPDLPLESRAVS